MKKLIVVFLVLAMVISLCACGKSEAVKNVEEQINGIGDVSVSSGNAIEKARNSYDELTEEEKTTVENVSALESAEISYVEIMISNIGEVNANSGEVISDAEKAYYNLDLTQRKAVTNYSDLETARSTYSAIQAEKTRLESLQPQQEFAAKLLTSCARCFVNPLSIDVKRAWVYHEEYLDWYYFTFEFDIANSAGTINTVFYGNDSLAFKDLSDEEISSAHAWFMIDAKGLFVENGITAMQEGEELDANAIQEFFLKNYGK